MGGAVTKPDGQRLLPICVASLAWAFSFGLGTQLVTHWLAEHRASDTVIGLIHSTYYLGLALASLAVPWLTRKLGDRCAGFGMVLAAVSLAAFPWAGGTVGWFVLRLVNGMAGALSVVPLEAIISSE